MQTYSSLLFHSWLGTLKLESVNIKDIKEMQILRQIVPWKVKMKPQSALEELIQKSAWLQ